MQFEKGIELLNQTEIVSANGDICIAIAFIVLMVVFFICMFTFYCTKQTEIDWLSIPIAAFIAVIVGWNAYEETPTGEYQYQVTIDDSVSLTEFYGKYNIIEQNGKIYTIELKDNDDVK